MDIKCSRGSAMWTQKSSAIFIITLTSLSLACGLQHQVEGPETRAPNGARLAGRYGHKNSHPHRQHTATKLLDNQGWTNEANVAAAPNHPDHTVTLTKPPLSSRQTSSSSTFERIVQAGARVRLVCPLLVTVAQNDHYNEHSTPNWSIGDASAAISGSMIDQSLLLGQQHKQSLHRLSFTKTLDLADYGRVAGGSLVSTNVRDSYVAWPDSGHKVQRRRIEWFKNHAPLVSLDENDLRFHQNHRQHQHHHPTEEGLEELTSSGGRTSFHSSPRTLSQIGTLSELDGVQHAQASEQQQQHQSEPTLGLHPATSSLPSSSSTIQAASGLLYWPPLTKEDENVNEQRGGARKLLFSAPETSTAAITTTTTWAPSDTTSDELHRQLSEPTTHGVSKLSQNTTISRSLAALEEEQPFYINKFGELVINKVSQYFAGKYTCSYSGKQSNLILHVQPAKGDSRSGKHDDHALPSTRVLSRLGGQRDHESRQKVSDKLEQQPVSVEEEVEISGDKDVMLESEHRVETLSSAQSYAMSAGSNSQPDNDGPEIYHPNGPSSHDAPAPVDRIERLPSPINGQGYSNLKPSVDAGDGSKSNYGSGNLELQLSEKETDPTIGKRLKTNLLASSAKYSRPAARRHNHLHPAHLVESEIISSEDLGSIPGLLYTRQQFICPAIRLPELETHLDEQIDFLLKQFCQGIETQTRGKTTTDNCYSSRRIIISDLVKNIHCAPTTTSTTTYLARARLARRHQHDDDSGKTRSGFDCTERPFSLLDVHWFKDGKLLQFDQEGRCTDPKLNAKLIDILDQFRPTSGEHYDNNDKPNRAATEWSMDQEPIVTLDDGDSSIPHDGKSRLESSGQTKTTFLPTSGQANHTNEREQLYPTTIQQDAIKQGRITPPACPLRGLTLEIDGIKKDTAGRYTCALRLSIQRLERLLKSLGQMKRLSLANCAHDNDKSCCDGLQENSIGSGHPGGVADTDSTSKEDSTDETREGPPVAGAQNFAREITQDSQRMGWLPLYEVSFRSNVVGPEVPVLAESTETTAPPLAQDPNDDRSWPRQLQSAQFGPINGAEVARNRDETEPPLFWGRKESPTTSGLLNLKQGEPNQADSDGERVASNGGQAIVLASGNSSLATSAKQMASQGSILNESKIFLDGLLDFILETKAKSNSGALMPFKALQTFVLAISENPANLSSVWSTITEADSAYSRRKLADFKRLKRGLVRSAPPDTTGSERKQPQFDDVLGELASRAEEPAPNGAVDEQTSSQILEAGSNVPLPLASGQTHEQMPDKHRQSPMLLESAGRGRSHDRDVSATPRAAASGQPRPGARPMVDNNMSAKRALGRQFPETSLGAETGDEPARASRNEIEFVQINGPMDHHNQREFNGGAQVLRTSGGRPAGLDNLLLNNAEVGSPVAGSGTASGSSGDNSFGWQTGHEVAETVSNRPAGTTNGPEPVPRSRQTIPRLTPATASASRSRGPIPAGAIRLSEPDSGNSKGAPFNYANEANFAHKSGIAESVPDTVGADSLAGSSRGPPLSGSPPLIVDELMAAGPTRTHRHREPTIGKDNNSDDGLQPDAPPATSSGVGISSTQIGQHLLDPTSTTWAQARVANDSQLGATDPSSRLATDNYLDDGRAPAFGGSDSPEEWPKSPRNNPDQGPRSGGQPGASMGSETETSISDGLQLSGASVALHPANRVSDYLRPEGSGKPLEDDAGLSGQDGDESSLIIDGNQDQGDLNSGPRRGPGPDRVRRSRRDTQALGLDQVRQYSPDVGRLAEGGRPHQESHPGQAKSNVGAAGRYPMTTSASLRTANVWHTGAAKPIGKGSPTHPHDPSYGHKLLATPQDDTATRYLASIETGQQKLSHACLGSAGGGDKSAISCRAMESQAGGAPGPKRGLDEPLATTHNRGPLFTTQTDSTKTSQSSSAPARGSFLLSSSDDTIEFNSNNVQVKGAASKGLLLETANEDMPPAARSPPELADPRRAAAQEVAHLAGSAGPRAGPSKPRRRLVRSVTDTTGVETAPTNEARAQASQLGTPNTSLGLLAIPDDDESLLWTAGQYLYLHMRAFAALSLYGVQVEVDWSNERVNGTNMDLESDKATNNDNIGRQHGSRSGGSGPDSDVLAGADEADNYFKPAYNRLRDSAPFATIDLVPGQNLHLECTAQALGRLPEVKWYKRIKSVERNLAPLAKGLSRRIGRDLYWPLTELDLLDGQTEGRYHEAGSRRSFVCSQSVTIFDNLINQTFTVINRLQLSQYNDFVGYARPNDGPAGPESSLSSSRLPGAISEDGHYNMYACIVDADVRHNYATLGVHFRTKVSSGLIPMELNKRLHSRSSARKQFVQRESRLDGLAEAPRAGLNARQALLKPDGNADFGEQKFNFLRESQLDFPLSSVWVPIKNVTYLRESNLDLARDLNSLSATPTILATIIVFVFGSLLGLVYLTLKSYQALTSFHLDDDEINLDLMKRRNNLQSHQQPQDPGRDHLMLEASLPAHLPRLQSNECLCNRFELNHGIILSPEQQFSTPISSTDMGPLPSISSRPPDNCTQIDTGEGELNFELFYANPLSSRDGLLNDTTLPPPPPPPDRLSIGKPDSGISQSGLYEAHFHSDDSHYIYHSVSISPDLPSKVETTLLDHHDHHLVVDCCANPEAGFVDALVPLDSYNRARAPASSYQVNMIENPLGTSSEAN